MQSLRSAVDRRQRNEDVPVLASLGRRAGRLVRHDICQILLVAEQKSVSVRSRRQVHVCGDPVADLAPFGVVARWRVRVRESDCELDAVAESVDGIFVLKGEGDGVKERD